MTISQGQFAGFFSRNIRCIDSTGQIHLYSGLLRDGWW